MSLYLQALARAVGTALEDGPDPLAAVPRPKSRFEDWPGGPAEATDAPDFDEVSGETEAPRSVPTAPVPVRPAPVPPEGQSGTSLFAVPPRAGPDAPSPPLRSATGASPSQAMLAAATAALPAPVVQASVVDAPPKPFPSTPVATSAPLPDEASLPRAIPSAVVAIPMQPDPVVAPPEASAPPVSHGPALPSDPPPAVTEARPVVPEVPALASPSDRRDAGPPQPLVIEIDRIEIRLDVPAAARPVTPSRRADDRSVLSLADYLSAIGPGTRRP
jgi:hypothetical protein